MSTETLKTKFSFKGSNFKIASNFGLTIPIVVSKIDRNKTHSSDELNEDLTKFYEWYDNNSKILGVEVDVRNCQLVYA